MSDGRNAQGYYSQNDEEKYILEWTPQTGNLLDIGAWWPTNLSNSRALIERGWSATLVEPSPGPMRVLLEEYGKNDKIKLLQAAVSTDGELVTFEVTDYPVSTSDHKVYSLWQTDPNTQYLGSLTVPSITIHALLDRDRYGQFDFMDIDAEGQSVNIALDLLEFKGDILPQCLCVEHDGEHERLRGTAIARGYTKFHLTSENLVAAK